MTVTESATKRSIPFRCPACCIEEIDTPEGRVPGFYGRLIFPADPPNPTCPNCGTALVPSHQDVRTLPVAA